MNGASRKPPDVPAGYDPSDYERPSVTVDMLIFTVMDDDLKVLFVRRKNPPHQGMWAFPGGFVDMDESLENAAVRELKEETNVDDPSETGYLEQLHTFGDPGRDPRTRVITVTYLALVRSEGINPKGGDDARDAAWHSAIDPPKLAFDHDMILERAMNRLEELACNTIIPFNLIPECFTWQDVQGVYELLLRRQLDKRNFRRRMTAMAPLERCEHGHTKSIGRPAILFKLADRADNIEKSLSYKYNKIKGICEDK